MFLLTNLYFHLIIWLNFLKIFAILLLDVFSYCAKKSLFHVDNTYIDLLSISGNFSLVPFYYHQTSHFSPIWNNRRRSSSSSRNLKNRGSSTAYRQANCSSSSSSAAYYQLRVRRSSRWLWMKVTSSSTLLSLQSNLLEHVTFIQSHML